MPLEAFASLLSQLGAVGLLGYLVWKVPEFIRMIRQWREATEKAHAEERTAWQDERQSWRQERLSLVATYKEEMRYEREECQRHFDRLAQLSLASSQQTSQAMKHFTETMDRSVSVMDKHDDLASKALDSVNIVAGAQQKSP